MYDAHQSDDEGIITDVYPISDDVLYVLHTLMGEFVETNAGSANRLTSSKLYLLQYPGVQSMSS